MSETKKKVLHISEVTAENNITISALMGKKQLDIQAIYADLNDAEKKALDGIYGEKYIPIELITEEYEGETLAVTFMKQNSKVEVVAVTPDGVFKFANVRILKFKFENGRAIHVIHGLNTKGLPCNRRRGVRINIDTRMELEQENEKIPVLVREISYCGFSFINLSKKDVDINKAFVLNLMERDGDRAYSIGKFVGKVLRVQKVDSGSDIYGCVLADKHASTLQKYVAMKQLEFLNGKKMKDIERNSNSANWRAEMADALGYAMEEDIDNR